MASRDSSRQGRLRDLFDAPITCLLQIDYNVEWSKSFIHRELPSRCGTDKITIGFLMVSISKSLREP